jgi:hypothetical protein
MNTLKIALCAALLGGSAAPLAGNATEFALKTLHHYPVILPALGIGAASVAGRFLPTKNPVSTLIEKKIAKQPLSALLATTFGAGILIHALKKVAPKIAESLFSAPFKKNPYLSAALLGGYFIAPTVLEKLHEKVTKLLKSTTYKSSAFNQQSNT